MERAAGGQTDLGVEGGVVGLAGRVAPPFEQLVIKPVVNLLLALGAVGPELNRLAQERRPEAKLKRPSLLETVERLRAVGVELDSQHPDLSHSHFKGPGSRTAS